MRRFLLGLLVPAALARAGNGANDWVWFDPREADEGPKLVLETPDGETRTLTATADTVLISYLSDRAWGRLPQLAVSLGDTNRVLVQFDVPEGEVARAELVLHVNPSQASPEQPFDVAFFRIREAWAEASTNWDNQPSLDEKPFASATIDPAKGEIRIDVTDAVKAGLPHGIALRVAKPLGPAPEPKKAQDTPPPPQPNPGAFLLEGLPWAPDIETAKERATSEKKHVLALVRVSYGGEELAFAEETLLATALQHPRVVALIKEHFIPVRVAYPGYLHTLGVEDVNARKDPRDPLPALGTSAADAKAPALVVATGEGKLVATLASIGTYDWVFVHEFLSRTSGPEVRKPTVGLNDKRFGEHDAAELLRGASDDEGRYWRGALLWRKGERDEATRLWRAIAPGAPFYPKAKARLLWPERMNMFECLDPLPIASGSTEMTAPFGVGERTFAYLIAQQRPDGSWASAQDYAPIDAAITALCARALRAHGKGDEAVKRATAWLRDYVAKTDPAEANGWSAAYTLDYFCDLFQEDPKLKEEAQKAVRLVEGGQGPEGAWSYAKNWGMRWTGGFGGWPKTDKGRYHSMNTGPCLLSLLRARDLGLEVDPKVLERGKEALLKMRDAAGVYTYTWPEPRNFNEPRSSIGRGPVCEHALFRLDGASKKDLETALGNFMRWRHGLRGTVKLTGGWTPPSCSSAYFYFFAYYHAAEALERLGDAKSRQSLRTDLLRCMEVDGTWVDYEPDGKPYATAMALLVLK